ncbi:hypothetical protein CISG_08030 [Coccidioides immitis RMSCC 3703]|uniref:Aminoglycoside phosphotransferase domain-containing protein n=2 Tax=Coccidioides immitis TaxID=5501 RepID=A0A0J8R5Q4_COCIT|nr:hypothetical protein CIRG_07568 [Coccidioides immitis RMSCC 2394]KMU79750.1 hypothetical protein CISG_08030 [Coccidioides immitis RMSCC 3703]
MDNGTLLPSAKPLEAAAQATLLAAHLPDASVSHMDFRDSSYFKSHVSLPTPEQVKERCNHADKTFYRPSPVSFNQLGLLVKFGQCVSVVEAQCIWAIRNLFGDRVPVPELYGWRVEGDVVFIYMEKVQGALLHDKWGSFSDTDKIAVCAQLYGMISSLRELRQDPAHPFIGSISGNRVLDYIFRGWSTGPFKTVNELHDWISWIPRRNLPDPNQVEDPYRAYLPDAVAIKFTHADLHRHNIIVSKTLPPQIVAIIDWEQAGWYPEYWEWCKACYTSDYEGEWRLHYMPMFLTPYHDEHNVFAEYVHFMGAI